MKKFGHRENDSEVREASVVERSISDFACAVPTFGFASNEILFSKQEISRFPDCDVPANGEYCFVYSQVCALF
jgi:hypothetical protein